MLLIKNSYLFQYAIISYCLDCCVNEVFLDFVPIEGITGRNTAEILLQRTKGYLLGSFALLIYVASAMMEAQIWQGQNYDAKLL